MTIEVLTTMTHRFYSEDDVDRIRGLTGCDGISYLVCGKECGANGTRHLQGFLQLTRKKTMGGVKNLFGRSSPHLEVRRGSPTQAAEYCKKENNFFEYGSLDTGRGQGNRTDLAEIQEQISGGSTLLDIANNHWASFVRYQKSFSIYKQLLSPRRNWRTQVVWLWGPTGSGKSKLAFEEAHAL